MLYAKKSLGQNFLSDLNITRKILNLTQIEKKNILEIGPGKGALTEEILKLKPKSLILIEKDNSLAKELKLKFYKNKTIKIYNRDFLDFEFENVIKNKTIIFGNLPYNISSQILAKIIKSKKWPPKYSDLILMFQKEMAERIIAKYGTSKYGRLAVLTNYRLKVHDYFKVSANCFFPKPKVESTVLYLKPKSIISNAIHNLENLEKVTNIMFSNRRKMINKSFKKLFKNKPQNIINDLDLKSRPSEIKPEKYYEITKCFEEN
jgi:16S rRNA (adenine1518-N6/adenine1519-N6)-dimethyltransferase